MRLAAALGTVYVVWGSTYLGIAVAERSIPPMLMLSIRFLVAGALMYAWAKRRGELNGAARPGRRQWGAAALVGFLLLVVETGAVAFSEKHIPTGVAALIVASVPLVMAVIDRAFFGVRIPLLAAVGILGGLAGVGLLAGGGGAVNPLWALVLLGGVVAWAAGSAYARVAPLPGGSVLSAAMQMLAAGAMLGVIAVAKGDLWHVHASALSFTSVGSIAYLVGFGSIGAYTAYGWLLKNAATPLLSTYAYVNPAVAVLLGWLFAGEHLGERELLAGLVVVGSVALILLARSPALPRVARLRAKPALP